MAVNLCFGIEDYAVGDRPRCAVTIGNFDGLHRGHQAVIGRAVAMANERAAPSALLTFEPHPVDFFAAGAA